MRPVILIWLSMVLVCNALGQIPRGSTGQFQYYGEVVTENAAHSMERAKSFFNQPFLVHWDTVARVEQPSNFFGPVFTSAAGY